MKETSELLKNARKAKNLTIEEISSQTKIQLFILKKFEEGNLEGLPNKIYLKGFLRQYAQALGLNSNDVVALFDKETSSTTPPPPASTPVARMENKELQDKTNVLWFRAPAKFISIIGVVIILALITSIYFFSMKIVSYSQETFQETPNVSAEEPTAADDTPQLQSILTKTEESLALPKPEAKPGEPQPAPTDEAEPPVADIKPKIVSVEASETVSIEASWSTGKKETIKLRANSRHVFYYAKKIKLIISDAGFVKITANDKLLGAPGEPGKPVTLNFE